MLLRVITFVMLVLSAVMVLFGLLGFIGWVADPSSNKWGALFCFVLASGAFAFFWSLHTKGAVWTKGFATMSPAQQSQQGSIMLGILIMFLGHIPCRAIFGKPVSMLDNIIEIAVLSGIYALCVFGFLRTKGVK